MKNGQYNQITEIGLPKNINGIYFNKMNEIADTFKKGKVFQGPLAVIINGDSKMVVPMTGMDKEEYVARLKIVCAFMNAEAIMIFSEASRWTGTQEQWNQAKDLMGDIHGHVKAIDIMSVAIETQGKQIMGWADVEVKGNKRTMKAMKWNVQDIPDEALFSNFLPKQKEAA